MLSLNAITQTARQLGTVDVSVGSAGFVSVPLPVVTLSTGLAASTLPNLSTAAAATLSTPSASSQFRANVPDSPPAAISLKHCSNRLVELPTLAMLVQLPDVAQLGVGDAAVS
jgi:hypothetical protein